MEGARWLHVDTQSHLKHYNVKMHPCRIIPIQQGFMAEEKIFSSLDMPNLWQASLVNDNWNNLEVICPNIMKNIERKLYIQKSEYQGRKKFDGNQCAKILQNLNLIESQIPGTLR